MSPKKMTGGGAELQLYPTTPTDVNPSLASYTERRHIAPTLLGSSRSLVLLGGTTRESVKRLHVFGSSALMPLVPPVVFTAAFGVRIETDRCALFAGVISLVERRVRLVDGVTDWVVIQGDKRIVVHPILQNTSPANEVDRAQKVHPSRTLYQEIERFGSLDSGVESIVRFWVVWVIPGLPPVVGLSADAGFGVFVQPTTLAANGDASEIPKIHGCSKEAGVTPEVEKGNDALSGKVYRSRASYRLCRIRAKRQASVPWARLLPPLLQNQFTRFDSRSFAESLLDSHINCLVSGINDLYPLTKVFVEFEPNNNRQFARHLLVLMGEIQCEVVAFGRAWHVHSKAKPAGPGLDSTGLEGWRAETHQNCEQVSLHSRGRDARLTAASHAIGQRCLSGFVLLNAGVVVVLSIRQSVNSVQEVLISDVCVKQFNAAVWLPSMGDSRTAKRCSEQKNQESPFNQVDRPKVFSHPVRSKVQDGMPFVFRHPPANQVSATAP